MKLRVFCLLNNGKWELTRDKSNAKYEYLKIIGSTVCIFGFSM